MVDLVNAFNVMNEFINTEPKAALLIGWFGFLAGAVIMVTIDKLEHAKEKQRNSAAKKIEKVG